MWSKRRVVLMLIMGIFLLFPSVGMAFIPGLFESDEDADDVMNPPDTVEEGGVEVESERFPMESYRVNNESNDENIMGIFVSISNAVMTFSGHVVLLVDTVLDELFSLNPIERFAGAINLISQSIYDTLQERFGQLLFLIAMGYITFVIVTKASFREAIRRFMLFIGVLIFAGFWMLNSGFFMQTFNALSLEMQGHLIDAGSGMFHMVDGDGVYDQSGDIDVEDPMDGTIAMMRNVYFELAMKRPYMIVNYGETSENAVNENDAADTEDYGGSQYNRFDRLLAFDSTEDGQALKQQYVEEEEVDQNENSSMGSGAVFTQLGQVLIGLLVALFLGIPFTVLGFLNFLLQLIALALAFFLPFSLILSYIPHFAYSGFKTFFKLLTVFLVKAMLGLIVAFVYVLTFVVETMVPPDTFGLYLANVTVLIFLLMLLMKKRDALVKLITAGRVQSLDGQFMNQVNQRMVNPAMDKVGKTVSAFNPTAGMMIHKMNRMRQPSTERPTPRSSSNAASSQETMDPQSQEQRASQMDQRLEDDQPSNRQYHQPEERRPQKDQKEKKQKKKEKRGDEKKSDASKEASRPDNKKRNKDGSTKRRHKRRSDLEDRPKKRSSKDHADVNQKEKRGDEKKQNAPKEASRSGNKQRNKKGSTKGKRRSDSSNHRKKHASEHHVNMNPKEKRGQPSPKKNQSQKGNDHPKRTPQGRKDEKVEKELKPVDQKDNH
ncbi:hypothetical protein HUG15_07235 [Salicibibacter cibarius]|uniref:Uncharacterized protein n=1 Tax=Salicibibacter cibarius TaxID=2743000 RepID=A0A7T6Z1V0_9BACI|nr:hypothetical protein [Salicibibacter cibarius]QQK75399.1 hypothetical protein HUG15_07235 [Salicibibacter cibarius]